MNIFRSFNVPVDELASDAIIRRAGLFYRKKIRLDEIQRIVAINRDAITHEEILVGFLGADERGVWLSEFDKNFSNVLESLQSIFPGLIGLDGFVSDKPFEKMERVLWTRPT